MTNIKGKVNAPDGWTITYNLMIEPQEIVTIQPDGQQDNAISGKVDTAQVKREIKAFLLAHGPQQPRLF